MKEAGTDLVSNFTGLNFGLMRFNYSNGGYTVLHHFSDIEDDRDAIIDKIDDIPASDWTPLNETLREAHRYFKGDSVDYGSAWNRDLAAVTRKKRHRLLQFPHRRKLLPEQLCGAAHRWRTLL